MPRLPFGLVSGAAATSGRDISLPRSLAVTASLLVGGAIAGGYSGFFLAPRASALTGSIVGGCIGVGLAVLGARAFRDTQRPELQKECK